MLMVDANMNGNFVDGKCGSNGIHTWIRHGLLTDGWYNIHPKKNYITESWIWCPPGRLNPNVVTSELRHPICTRPGKHTKKLLKMVIEIVDVPMNKW